MIGIGPAEWAVIFLWVPMLTGMPLGLPPGPEDPVMARMAPEECLFYATWSPRAEADPNSENHTEQLLAEPEVQRFVTTLHQTMQRGLDRAALNAQDPAASLVANAAPKLVAWLFSETGAASVNSFDMTEAGPQISANLIVRLGETGRDVPELLRQFQKFAPPGSVESVRIQGIDAHRIVLNPQAPEIIWGVAKGYLVAGVGSGSFDQLLDRMNGRVPGWLSALQTRAKIERRSSLSFLNVAAIAEIGRKLGGETASHYIDALGLANVHAIESVTGLDKTGFVARTLIRMDGEPTGIFTFLNAPPLKKEELKVIPRDAYVALAARFEISKSLTNVLDLAARINPDAASQMRLQLQQLEEALRLRVQEDVLDVFGDRIIVYAAPSTGGVIAGWTAAIEIKDRERLQNLIGRLVGMLPAGGPADRMPVVKRLSAHGEDIEYLIIPDEVPFSPAWCITEDELIIGLFPQAVVGHLSNRAGENSLVDQPALARMWDKSGETGPLGLSYVDTQTIFSLVYPMLQMGATVAMSEARKNGIDIDIGALPASSSLTPHLRPTVAAVRRVEDGFELTQHQTLPGGSIGASAPVSVALLLPAVQAARQAARRTKSSNNLKQILLALHNYHDTYSRFPAAYNVDPEGKPLLSWRVHILPFVEQAQLYEQFHLDEPWDSEHNKALIAQIPDVYRSPRSVTEEGMTNYLTVRGEKTAFPPPTVDRNGIAKGLGLQNILDGTSNTVGVVEVNDEHAVIWTKPDDYEYDDEDPLAGLTGTWGDSFLVALCDGSVQTLPITIGAEILNAMFTRDGGEAVQFPR